MLSCRPEILVGSAAAATHTQGAFMSANIDVVAGLDEAFGKAMKSAGLIKDIHVGHGSLGWYHPDHHGFSVEQVSGGYFDGRADRERWIKPAVLEGSAPRTWPIGMRSGRSRSADRTRSPRLATAFLVRKDIGLGAAHW